MQPETLALIRTGGAKKGDVLGVARLAGIMASKRTADLIPLCHPLPISAVTLDLEPGSGRQRHRDCGDGADHGPHRRGDGGADGGQHRRAHGLRHVQGRGPRDADRRPAGRPQGRRQIRRLPAGLTPCCPWRRPVPASSLRCARPGRGRRPARRLGPRAGGAGRGPADAAAHRCLGHGRLRAARCGWRARRGAARGRSGRRRGTPSPAASGLGRRSACSPAALSPRARTRGGCRKTSRPDGDRITLRQCRCGRPPRPARGAGLCRRRRVGAGRRRVLGARAVGLAAAGNHPWMQVHRRPRVAILATGDEIALPGEPIGARRHRQFQRPRDCRPGASRRRGSDGAADRPRHAGGHRALPSAR